MNKKVKEIQDKFDKLTGKMYVLIPPYKKFKLDAISLLHSIKKAELKFENENDVVKKLQSIERELREFFYRMTGTKLRMGTAAKVPNKVPSVRLKVNLRNGEKPGSSKLVIKPREDVWKLDF